MKLQYCYLYISTYLIQHYFKDLIRFFTDILRTRINHNLSIFLSLFYQNDIGKREKVPKNCNENKLFI